MNSKQRYNKRKDELILKLHGYGLSIEQIVKETRKSAVHVDKTIRLFRGCHD